MIGRSMVPTYLRYIVPSMIAFTLTSIYGIVDGLFVGNVVGDAGLAGINVSFPLVQFVFAVGTGIGMGGAVISSIRAGRGDEASSRRAVGNTLLMLVVASLPLMAVLLMFGAPLSELLGGRGATPCGSRQLHHGHRVGHALPGVAGGLPAAHPQPGARELRHGGLGALRPGERRLGLAVCGGAACRARPARPRRP